VQHYKASKCQNYRNFVTIQFIKLFDTSSIIKKGYYKLAEYPKRHSVQPIAIPATRCLLACDFSISHVKVLVDRLCHIPPANQKSRRSGNACYSSPQLEQQMKEICTPQACLHNNIAKSNLAEHQAGFFVIFFVQTKFAWLAFT
jgi:hypothetical protein